MGNRSVFRSLVAGALIGFADAVPLDAVRLRRPLGVVWIDDREVPDPLDGVPLLVLDAVPLARSRDTRRVVSGTLRLALASPLRLLGRLGDRLRPD